MTVYRFSIVPGDDEDVYLDFSDDEAALHEGTRAVYDMLFDAASAGQTTRSMVRVERDGQLVGVVGPAADGSW